MEALHRDEMIHKLANRVHVFLRLEVEDDLVCGEQGSKLHGEKALG
jgi:hypothetical protein